MERLKKTSQIEPVIAGSWIESNKCIKQIAHKLKINSAHWTNSSSVLKYLAKSVFWVLVIVVCAFYTVQTSVVLITDYAAGRTSSNLKTMFNKSITLPLSTVCLPLIPSELDEYQKLIGNTLTNANTTIINKHHYQEVILGYFNNVTKRARENVLDNNIRWPNSLLLVVHHYLALLEQLHMINYNEGENSSSGFGNITNDLRAAIKIFEEQLKILNIKTSELREKFGHDVSIVYGFAAVHTTDDGQNSTSIQKKRVSYVGLEQICYQLPFDCHPFQKEKDLITVKVNHATLPNARKYSETKTLQAFIDFRGRAMVDASMDDNNDVFSSQFEELWFVPIRISAVYKAMPVVKGNVQCSESKSKEHCKSECQNSRIQKMCNCTPLSTPLTPFFNECYLSQLSDCQKNIQSLEEYDELVNCKSGCVEYCEWRIYELTDANYQLTSRNSMEIRLSVVSFDYPTYEETPTWMLSSFVGSLGGVLGLWLGLDIMVILKFVGGALKSLVGKKKSCALHKESAQNAQEETNRKTESSPQTFVSVLRRPSVRTLQTTISAQAKEKSLKWIAQKMIWALIVIVLGLLTGVLVSQTYENYSRQPTVSNLKVMFNKSMTLPPGTLCLPLYLGELDRKAALDVSYSQELSAFFNDENVTKGIILNYEQNWTSSFLHVVHSYLIEISKYDYLKINVLQDTDKEGDLYSAMRTLETNLRKLNVSTDELRQKFGNETAMFYSLYMEEYGIDPQEHSYYQIIDVGRTKFVGEKQICYQIRFDLILLNQFNYISIFFSEHSLPNPSKLGMKRDWIIVDLLDRSHVDTGLIGMVDYIFPAAFDACNKVKIEAAAQYRALPKVKDEVRCSTEETVDECQAICRVQAIQELCDCMSTSWPDLRFQNARNLNECTIDEYTSRLNITEAILNVSNCLSGCLRPCERWTYKMTYYFLDRADSLTNIELSLDILNYLIIEEQPKWRFESFLGEIGGIIGLLLGYNLWKISLFLFSTFITWSTILCSNATSTDRKASVDGSVSGNRIARLDITTLTEQESSIAKRRQAVYKEATTVTKMFSVDSKFSVNMTSMDGRSWMDETISANGRTLKEGSLTSTRQINIIDKKVFKVAGNKVISEQHGTKKKMGQFVNEVCETLKIGREELPTTGSAVQLIRWIVPTVFKWMVITFFTYKTMAMGLSLVHRYKEEKTISVMNLNLNKSLALPISSACMDFAPRELNEFHGINETELSGNEYQDQIQLYFAQKNLTKEKFLIEMNATTTVLYIVAEYLTTLTTAEASSQTDMINRSSTDSALPNFFAERGKDLYSAQMLLEEQIYKLEISISDLRQAFGRHIADMFSLSAAQVSKANSPANTVISQKIIPIGQVTSVGKESICYQIRFDQYPFNDLQDIIVITGRAANESLPNVMINENRYLTIDFSAGNNTGIESDIDQAKDLEFNFDTFGQAKVYIDSVYHSLSTISDGCSEKGSMDVCLADCRTKFIRRLCNCTVTSWSTYSSSSLGTDECKLSDYTACLNYSAKDDDICTISCVDSCERWIFRSYYRYGRSNSGVRIEIQMIGFDYTLFEEQKKWTFERITGAIGGVLDFYLGLSIFKLTQLAMIVFAKLSGIVQWAMKTK